MSAKRRFAPTCVVLATAAIAACLGPALSSTEQSAVVASGSQVAFATTEVGSASSAVIRISPQSGSGTSSDTIESVVENCADFSVMGPSLPATVARQCSGSGTNVEMLPTLAGDPGAVTTCTTTVVDFTAVFQPLTAGAKSCALVFSGKSSGGTPFSLTVELLGTATPPPFAMRATPSSINFGDVRVNTTVPGPAVTISNLGSMTLTVASALSGSAFLLSVGNGAAHALGAGSDEMLTVSCRPPNTQLHTGMLMVTGTNVPPVNIPLRCQGTNSQLESMPRIVDLPTRVYEEQKRTIMISNTGTAVANITAYSVTGEPGLTLLRAGATGPLAIGASTTVEVSYLPTGPRAGGDLGTLAVTNDGMVTQISITGQAKTADIGIDPAVVNFGAVCAGKTRDVSVTVRASLEGQVGVVGLQPPAAPFTVTPKLMLPQTAQGNQKSVVELVARVAPTDEASLESAVILQTDVPKADKTFEAPAIRLVGEALAPGISATPRLVDFGGVTPGAIPPGKPVQLTNCKGSPIEVTGARIEGRDAKDFGIAAPADPHMTVQPDQHGEFLIVLSPGAVGPKQATLLIEHADGLTAVALAGTTLGATDGDRRESYYECGAGGAAAPWPIALALGALLRRRRRAAR